MPQWTSYGTTRSAAGHAAAGAAAGAAGPGGGPWQNRLEKVVETPRLQPNQKCGKMNPAQPVSSRVLTLEDGGGAPSKIRDSKIWQESMSRVKPLRYRAILLFDVVASFFGHQHLNRS